ncbi:hypothetical protein L7F22_051607 [Adiantum nelumboides]|nr:hypothetical protein [Adiantum nelumboides]
MVEAKKEVDLRMLDVGISVCLKDKWHLISEFCKESDILRTKAHCKSKWEKVSSTFNRINNYERNTSSGCSNYWQMTISELKARGLPTEEFSSKLYKKMEQLFGGDSNVNVEMEGLEYAGSISQEQPNEEENTTPTASIRRGGTIGDNASFRDVRRKRRARVNGGNQREMAESAQRLATVFEEAQKSKANRHVEIQRKKEEARRATQTSSS